MDNQHLDTFNQFYALYPRKVSKKLALKVWLKLKPDKELFEKIVQNINLRLKTEWKDREKQYIPHPSTYLNGERWEDEIESEKTQKDSPLRW